MKPSSPQQSAVTAETIAKINEIIISAGNHMTGSTIPEVHKKGHADYVTDMDLFIQNELVNHLEGLFPDTSFILEEQDIQPSPASYTWIIDPIDGTQNYINGCRCSAVCAALLERNEPVYGVVYNPYTQELFSARKGSGACLNGRPISVSTKELKDAVICMGTSPYRTELHDRTLHTFGQLYAACADIRRSGSAALDLCAVACGRADGFFEYSLCPWDYAAAAIIISEAGGQISLIGDPAWDFTKKGGIVAGNPRTFTPLKEITEAKSVSA